MQKTKKSKLDVNLLVVDDEPILRDLIIRTLARSGYKNIVAASSGSEALKAIETTTFDLVLSDVRMPDGDGLYLLDTLREKSPNLPILVFLTGFGEVSARECQARGAFYVLAKPCPRAVLLGALDEALGFSAL